MSTESAAPTSSITFTDLYNTANAADVLSHGVLVTGLDYDSVVKGQFLQSFDQMMVGAVAGVGVPTVGISLQQLVAPYGGTGVSKISANVQPFAHQGGTAQVVFSTHVKGHAPVSIAVTYERTPERQVTRRPDPAALRALNNAQQTHRPGPLAPIDGRNKRAINSPISGGFSAGR